MQLLSEKSMSRWLPAKGTAGFARSRVSSSRRPPAPPARTITSGRRLAMREALDVIVAGVLALAVPSAGGILVVVILVGLVAFAIVRRRRQAGEPPTVTSTKPLEPTGRPRPPAGQPGTANRRRGQV